MPCIFCGSTSKPHKEDVLPQWLRDEFPDDKSGQRVDVAQRHISADALGVRVSPTGASMYASRVSCVCRSCNNRWMSDIENAAKPIALPLIKGERFAITAAHVKRLVLWITLKAMVAEFLESRPMRAVTGDQHRYFAQHLRPPATTRIWIGTHGEEGDRTLHLRQLAWSLGATEVEVRNAVQSNVKLTLFILGRLFAICLIGRDRLIRGVAPDGGVALLTVPLFPEASVPLTWPLNPISYDLALEFGNAFNNAFRVGSGLYSVNTARTSDLLR